LETVAMALEPILNEYITRGATGDAERA